MDQNKRPTIRDVAAEANVSVATVNRVLGRITGRSPPPTPRATSPAAVPIIPGNYVLRRTNRGGKGILLGGVPGVRRGQVQQNVGTAIRVHADGEETSGAGDQVALRLGQAGHDLRGPT